MDLQGNGLRGSGNNPKAVLSSLLNRRKKLQQELQSVEKQVYELETSYLQDTGTLGNALKGFDGFLSSSKNTSTLKRSRKFQLEDRVFSLSSVTSPAAEELRVGKEDGKSDMIQGRAKGSGLALSAAQGKQKKGRNSRRDVKKNKISSDLDPDEDDDNDDLR